MTDQFEFKGTPGPWSFRKSQTMGMRWNLRGADKSPIGVAYGSDDEGKNNAVLVSAAPEMFEVLKRALQIIELNDSSAFPALEAMEKDIERVLKKAMGE